MIDLMRNTFGIIKGIASGIAEYFCMKLYPSVLLPGFGFLFGFGSEKIMLALFCLIAMDFVTGIVSAKKSGMPIESRRAVKSAYKVAIYGLLVSAGHLTEGVVPFTAYIEEAVTTFLALTELISIVENAGKMGFAVPQRLLNQLQVWRDGANRAVGLDIRSEEDALIKK